MYLGEIIHGSLKDHYNMRSALGINRSMHADGHHNCPCVHVYTQKSMIGSEIYGCMARGSECLNVYNTPQGPMSIGLSALWPK